ncbi:TlpA family protein disulfide reductase [Defluviimonas sp. WL0002]|uniref:TlpA family protein disulfide reductase n=1 Tax=Albidovulum marisflavi TaxID=2984159 RepID=A0ABT2Z7R1_9RHOB|nr:TlpA disulfide reductase family protein [Defluviimonas sp. WL0002]MCV2867155.1 TlpA family protein disulfide reductase [Defluviimonas sp. WL0002]
MRKLFSAVLYTALAFGANAQTADMPSPDRAALEALRSGDMQKLVFSEEPQPVPKAILLDAEGAEHDLSEYAGRYVLLNFWATWCAPCRAELGSLDRLEAAHGGDRFAVVTVATGPNPVPAIRKLFEEEGITRLPILRDTRQQFARSMGVLGLPISVILDPEGREIGRLIGDAVWDSPEAQAIIAALIGG